MSSRDVNDGPLHCGVVIKPSDYAVDENGCWIWQGFVNKAGYGQTTRGGIVLAHHIAWVWRNGEPIPKGWHVHHKCEVPACVNPDHLERMTPRQHFQHHHLKALTLDDIREIRELGKKRGRGAAKVAEQYGVSDFLIKRIWRGDSWREELGDNPGPVEIEDGECIVCGGPVTGRRHAVYCGRRCRDRMFWIKKAAA